tara:strand:+ start:398 stop:619 length:222 start_codon:yes stop_codon:yes gene_type:complete
MCGILLKKGFKKLKARNIDITKFDLKTLLLIKCLKLIKNEFEGIEIYLKRIKDKYNKKLLKWYTFYPLKCLLK